MGSIDAPAAALETVWLDSNRFADAERRYYEAVQSESKQKGNPSHVSSTLQEVRQEKQVAPCVLDIKKQEQPVKDSPAKHGDSVADLSSGSVINRMEKLEQEHNAMQQEIEKLTDQLKDVLSELSQVRDFMKKNNVQNTTQVKKTDTKSNIQNGSSAANDDDDLDLFGSEEENEEDAKVREERLKAYAEKKSKKPTLVAKSSVVLDVKPWDDETDMKAMEMAVRKVTSDGLVWGASKLVPLAFGIKKLQIVAIVEDEKVSIDWLQETIGEIEDLVQSVDIAAFNKL